MEVGQEFNKRREADASADVNDLHSIALEITTHCLSHNAEADACDLLLELEILDKLIALVDSQNFQRICLYLTRFVEPFSRQDLQRIDLIFPG
jgi:26S proteasome regulatory subunit N1